MYFIYSPHWASVRDVNETHEFRSLSDFAPDGCGAIFPSTGQSKPDIGISGCEFEISIASAGDSPGTQNQHNIKYFG
jgi:hypothetical protein